MRIMLACHTGISTSLLVSRMKDAAEAAGEDHVIWAVEQDRIEEEVGNFDILMLGPQVRHIMRRVKGIVGDAAPVVVIDAPAYGRGDGAAVIAQAKAAVGGAA